MSSSLRYLDTKLATISKRDSSGLVSQWPWDFISCPAAFTSMLKRAGGFGREVVTIGSSLRSLNRPGLILKAPLNLRTLASQVQTVPGRVTVHYQRVRCYKGASLRLW